MKPDAGSEMLEKNRCRKTYLSVTKIYVYLFITFIEFSVNEEQTQNHPKSHQQKSERMG